MQYDDVLGREAENELSSTQPDRPAVLANRNSYTRQEKRDEDIRAGLVGSMKIIAGGKDYMDEQESDEVFLNLADDYKGSQSWTFGRAGSANFVVARKARLSKIHFIVEHTGGTKQRAGTVVIRDVSLNGTSVNGRYLGRGNSALLQNGDVITVGAMEGVATQDNPDETKFIFTHHMGQEVPYDENSFHAKYDMSTDLLGSGAFANVYKCVARDGGPVRAVKQIMKSKVKNPGAVQREIRVLKRITHPGVVQLIDHFEDDQCHYLVMELMENGDLMDFISEFGAIPEFVTREIVKQVLETVRDFHAMGVSHRDIKPDNILVFQDDPVIVKVSDFGLAKVTQDSILNTFCGTMAYIAPEILLSRERRKANSADPGCYSNLVDMWSIGCLCYVLATGYLPFDGTSHEAIVKAITAGTYCQKPLNDFNISPMGRDFIKCLLTVDPEERPSAIQILRHPWFSDESVRLRANQGDAAEASPQASLDSDKFQDIRRATIIGDGPDPNSIPPLMDDNDSEIRSRGEPISVEGLVLTDNLEARVGGATSHASELAREAVMEERRRQELEDAAMDREVQNEIRRQRREAEEYERAVEAERRHQQQLEEEDRMMAEEDEGVKVHDGPVDSDFSWVNPSRNGNGKNKSETPAEMEARIRKELERKIRHEVETRVRAETQSILQAQAEQAARIRAEAEAQRMAEADTDNDESDMEDGSVVKIPAAGKSRRARPNTWLNLKSLPSTIHEIEFDITGDNYRIGRVVSDNQIVIDKMPISKDHCIFEKRIMTDPQLDGFYKIFLHDVSRNGVRVNSEKVGKGKSVQLQHGDIIHLFLDPQVEGGSLSMLVSFESPEYSHHDGPMRSAKLLISHEISPHVVAEQVEREMKRLEQARAEAARAEFNARTANGAVTTPVQQVTRQMSRRASRNGVKRDGETLQSGRQVSVRRTEY
ncbi:Serine/threonine-protein kinase RAD53 [Yarrowia sp. B02]|nr:Serine/threonine-protein kinase RAD53 [Yarrowia sp. B02]